jgi:hypothetical protein
MNLSAILLTILTRIFSFFQNLDVQTGHQNFELKITYRRNQHTISMTRLDIEILKKREISGQTLDSQKPLFAHVFKN